MWADGGLREDDQGQFWGEILNVFVADVATSQITTSTFS